MIQASSFQGMFHVYRKILLYPQIRLGSSAAFGRNIDPRQATYIQVSEFTVRGAQPSKPLADLSIREIYRWVPPGVPAGLPFNVAQRYMRMRAWLWIGQGLSFIRRCLRRSLILRSSYTAFF
jgi:hypothetical protein